MIQLEENESILFKARKHWFIFASEVFFAIIFAALPAALFLVPEEWVTSVAAEVAFEGSPLVALFFIWTLWVLLLWIIVALLWTDYYLDVWLITNHKIIDIDQRGLFNRSVSTFRFDQIQDVTVIVPGLLATLIDYGTIQVQTASEESFKMKGVAHPNELKARILSEHHRVHQGP